MLILIKGSPKASRFRVRVDGLEFRALGLRFGLRDGASPLRVQVPNIDILSQKPITPGTPKPKYLIIGYLDPLGRV